MDVTTVQAGEVTGELVESLTALLRQLSRSAPHVDHQNLSAMVAHPANRLLVARTGGAVVGMLTLVMVPLLTGLRARIEDVVVDEVARGQGVGAALTQEALRLATAAGARTVDLTSRPSREAANRLYQRLGFKARDSVAYRFEPEPAG